MQAALAGDPGSGCTGEPPAPEASDAALCDSGSGGAPTEPEGSAGSTGEPLRLARQHTNLHITAVRAYMGANTSVCFLPPKSLEILT